MTHTFATWIRTLLAAAVVGVAALPGASTAAAPSNTSTIPVRIVTGHESQPNAVGLVADLGTAAHRAGPGDRLPVYAAVRNDGNAPLTEFRISVDIPVGGALVERYRDCTYSSMFPNGDGPSYQYFPVQAECHLSLTLQPGETLPLFDPSTGVSLFHATFGRNLPGPDKLQGLFTATPEDDPHRPDKGNGPSFSDAVQRLPIVRPGSTPQGGPPLHGDQGITPIFVFTRPNTFDIALTRPVFSAPGTGGGAGTIGVGFSLIDNGPSDSGALEYVITAPKGTVLLYAGPDLCSTQGLSGALEDESAALVCRTESPFPTVHANVASTPRYYVLKIKSAPGGGGKITVRGTGVHSTESNWSNNTVPLVLKPADIPAGPGRGGLPITGAPIAVVAGVGAGVVLLGLGVLIATRRRTGPGSDPGGPGTKA